MLTAVGTALRVLCHAMRWPRSLTRTATAVDLLEKFRQGPENQNEWNLFLWRVAFPMLTLVLCTALAVLGKFGHLVYSLTVCPVWYFCHFALIVHPFFLVFHFPELDDAFKRRLWRALAFISLAISMVEWYISSPKTRTSWIVGNTLFGIVALVAVPKFFASQPHVGIEHYEPIPSSEELWTEMLNTATGGGSVIASPRAQTPPAPSTNVGSNGDAASKDTFEALRITIGGGSTSARLPPTRSSSSLPSLANGGIVAPPSGSRKRSPLVVVSVLAVAVTWLAMFAAYSTQHGGEAAARVWSLLYVASPVLCLLLYVTRSTPSNTFCFQHMLMYAMLVLHLPVFLGHLCIQLFAMAEDGLDPSWTSWTKLGITVFFLGVMQGYFYLMTHVVNAMSEPFAHPSLMYIGQLYYYLFWYMLVGSDAPIDALYCGMLLVNNIHIAFLNTGLYTDVKEQSTSCMTLPVSLSVGSSMAMCYRASAQAGRSKFGNFSMEMDSQDEALIGLVLDEPRGEEDGYDSSQEVSHLLSSGNQRPSRRAASSAYQEAKRQSSLPTTGSSTNLSAMGQRKKKASVLQNSHQTSIDQMRPLYFLMKLAEQDNMADTTALIMVPSLLTLLAVFGKPAHGFAILVDQMHMWLRCICMFVARVFGAYLAREIFLFKLRRRLRSSGSNALSAIEGLTTRLWVQRLMQQDFHRQFWYLIAVTLVVTFTCFEREGLPFRFALVT
ncbi:TPA: hypothetical protein N0F65_002350 [Lagenidium giganteum]|uniref:Transmembrane protein n=1 Tax=Lagenidium giganteum TaxID=4803 RepID=A0AAV2Z5W2_9STRA|nr:TPA: hypothetical protein N0F65_002350 [Lagenidium giganteum]